MSAGNGGLSRNEQNTLRVIQRTIGQANADKGFHEEGEELRHLKKVREGSSLDTVFPDAQLRKHYSEKLLLIVSEVTEAHDELRKGKGMTETYYSGGRREEDSMGNYSGPLIDGKPEGVPSELADVVIRAFDLAHEAGIDLAAMIDEKLTYNATRPFKHGKKF